MTEHNDDCRVDRQAMRYSTKYTYRTHWEERFLVFTISCDEVKLYGLPYGSRTERLLDEAQHMVAYKVAHDLERNLKVPQAAHPENGTMITCESRMLAMSQALQHQIPFEPVYDATFTADEQRILSSRLHWDPSDIALVSGHDELSPNSESMIIGLLDDLCRSLMAVFIGVAAKQRQRGNEAEAAAMDRIRYDVEDQYLHLDLSHRSAKIDAIHRFLRLYAYYERILCAGELSSLANISDDERWKLMTVQPTLPMLHDYFATMERSCMQLSQVLQSSMPWALMMLDMPQGWSVRFGGELIDDMQAIIDAGLDGFRLEQVKEKWGKLCVSFDDDPWDAVDHRERDESWMRLADVMRALLSCYQGLSGRTCIRCGSWHDVRTSVDGWIYPICRRCQYTDSALSQTDFNEVWDSMVKMADNIVSLTSWADIFIPKMRDLKLKHAHIHKLLQLCDEGRRRFA